ncbi:hypothetical protein BC936DRAFT_145213 [Jimgerdemannia flammicorona]|uniref:B30.2/SPRY domain-containing protein n=1 Tax=Jimgerdemannia flammicorona TaxID=994334 RepID=A0A433DAN0_9FUNG|nr:hypothetical protein BC936DRAFT_145213 [Jimgerdemannia flammicorona]
MTNAITAAYNPATLSWNPLHTINDRHKYCYCGRDRNLTELSVQCRDCLNWFHSTCISVPLHPALPFVTNYKFICRNCNATPVDTVDTAAGAPGEHFERTTAGWKDICATAIANLILEQLVAHVTSGASKGKDAFDSRNADAMCEWKPGKYYFNKKDHIIPFVDRNWKSLCTDRARTPTWWATLGSCLYITKDVFAAKDERTRSAASDFCLVDSDLWNFRPGHVQTASNKFSNHVPRPPREKRKSEHYDSPSAMFSNSIPGSAPPGKRQTRSDRSVVKRAPSGGNSGSSASPYYTILSPSALTSTSSSIFPTSAPHQQEHPFNRGGFKYVPCSHDPLLPVTLYRRSDNPLGSVLSQTDTSPYLYLSENQLTATTEKGFRMVRANVGVREGKWFWECVVIRGGEGKVAEGLAHGGDGAHVRIGWARRESCLNAPVGFDAYAYGFRDLTGERIHCSLPDHFGEPFHTGDVIGLYISLPGKRPHARTSEVRRRRIPIKFKSQLWFEEKDYIPTKEMNALSDSHRDPTQLAAVKPNGPAKTQENGTAEREATDMLWTPPIIPGSKIVVYKNGVCLGVAFENLYDFDDLGGAGDNVADARGSLIQQREGGPSIWAPGPPAWDDGTLGYYPAVSVFKGGTITCNFGPRFLFPPPVDPEVEAERVRRERDEYGEDIDIGVEGTGKVESREEEERGRTWRPLSERWAEYMVEECIWDLVDEVEAWSNKALDDGVGIGVGGLAMMDVDGAVGPREVMEEREDEAEVDTDGNGNGEGYGNGDVDVGMESDTEEGPQRERSDDDNRVDETSRSRSTEAMVIG